jgi:hypothetical protein
MLVYQSVSKWLDDLPWWYAFESRTREFRRKQTFPYTMSWGTSLATVSIGIANPTPADVPAMLSRESLYQMTLMIWLYSRPRNQLEGNNYLLYLEEASNLSE